jgi:hypothetical protein
MIGENMKISMFYLMLLAYSTLVFSNDVAIYGEELKPQYNTTPNMLLAQTGEKAPGVSIRCQLIKINGNLIPEAYFVMEPLATLELYEGVKSMGFAYIEKYNEPVLLMRPIGNLSNGEWIGDVFSSWENNDIEYTVYSERGGASGIAHFNLIEGDGFYTKSFYNTSPDYGLRNCKRSKIDNLPLYEFKRLLQP